MRGNFFTSFGGTVVTSILFLIAIYGWYAFAEIPAARVAIAAVALIVLFLRMLYKYIDGLYRRAVIFAFSRCETKIAMSYLSKLEKLDFLRLYRSSILEIMCQLVIDLDEKDYAERFYDNNPLNKEHSEGEKLSIICSRLSYLFCQKGSKDEFNALYSQLKEYTGKTSLNENTQKTMDALYEAMNNGFAKALSLLKEIDEKEYNNRDKAYYLFYRAAVSPKESAEYRKDKESALQIASNIPFIGRVFG